MHLLLMVLWDTKACNGLLSFTSISLLITSYSTSILLLHSQSSNIISYIYNKYCTTYILFHRIIEFLHKEKKIENMRKWELQNPPKSSSPVSKTGKPNFRFENFYIPYQEGNAYFGGPPWYLWVWTNIPSFLTSRRHSIWRKQWSLYLAKGEDWCMW